jgi:hypothetical protein
VLRVGRGVVWRVAGETSRGPWGARRLRKVRGLGRRAARKPRAADGRGTARAARQRGDVATRPGSCATVSD